ncbi:hypothetical protein EASAB2608_05160 [Streptomyces sp. EAS-AB2608]|uniref:DMT family transporter n=1 Tax=Streptomyces sp. EAS-AB2608 TaxID=2779671 RepID=UPI001BEDF81E|nr:DMT family transporter [Streptomyces sp. EAS-AB2608]BCM69826.1 hypothetical protein EASAB2608_05160 [Streptomyces sp. EAS-AB2608]
MLRVAVLALLWGSGYLWTGLALRHGLSPLHITVVRAVLGAGVLLLLAWLSRQHLPRGAGVWRRIAVAALLCNTLPFFLAAQGVRTVSTGLAGVLNATTPLWSLLIGLALGTERDRRPVRFAGLLLGFAGVLLIFSPWSAPSSSAAGGSTGWGVMALLGAALSYAVAFAYMGRYLTGTGAGTGAGTDARAGGGTGPLAVSAAQLTAAAGLGALALPAGGTSTGWTDPVALAAVAVLGIFCTGFTFHLNYRLIALEGPTAAATVGYLLPVVSTALGALVLHEPLGARTVAGMAVVLAGVHLARHRRPAPTPPTTSVPAASSAPAAASASVPAPPASSVPAAASASVPAPPASSVPAAASASVPAPPASSVPAAASASVPAPPASSVPAARVHRSCPARGLRSCPAPGPRSRRGLRLRSRPARGPRFRPAHRLRSRPAHRPFLAPDRTAGAARTARSLAAARRPSSGLSSAKPAHPSPRLLRLGQTTPGRPRPTVEHASQAAHPQRGRAGTRT